MILSILYIVFGILCFICVVNPIAFAQSLMAFNGIEGMMLQPFAKEEIRKNQILIMAIFELPLMLIALGMGYIFSITTISTPYTSYLLISYCITLLSVAWIIVHASAHVGKNFLIACAHHPSYAKKLMNKFIVILSILQAPLLLSLITIMINFTRIKSLFESNLLYQEHHFISLGLMIMLIIVCFGVVKGIAHATATFMNVSWYNPEAMQKGFISIMLSMGLLEMPVLFSLLLSVVITQLLHTIKITQWPSIFSILIVFGILASIVAYVSAQVISKSLNAARTNEEYTKKFLSVGILSQFFIDARVLYMIIVVTIIILKNLN